LLPPPQFNISFSLGRPEQPADVETSGGLESGDVEVSGDVELSSDEPAELPYEAPVQAVTPSPLSASPEVEAPRLPPDPKHPNALTIDSDGTVWRSLLHAARGSPEEDSDPETAASSFAKRQEALERRKREARERIEQENERAREAARTRAAKLKGEL
jgi:hypothetical protein